MSEKKFDEYVKKAKEERLAGEPAPDEEVETQDEVETEEEEVEEEENVEEEDED
jgi:hypothetical protein